MDLLQIGSTVWRSVIALALVGVTALGFVFFRGRFRRRGLQRRASLGSVNASYRRDPKWVSREIERLCSGEEPDAPLIRHMSGEDRALFEVSIIDALNRGTREGQHRLRSALIKYGYDEQCSRRVLSEDFSDRVRATQLLNLLRPQGRDNENDADRRLRCEGSIKVEAAGRATLPSDPE